MKQVFQKLALFTGCAVILSAASVPSFASGDHNMPAPQSNPAFDRMKALSGEWQGTMIEPDSGKETTVKVRYEVTSGGTTLVERTFVGTPHEMITMYYPEGNDRVGMTHYCMLGNRPQMSLNKADDQSLSFEATGAEAASSANGPQMRGLTLNFEGQNQLVQKWSCSENGKMKEPLTVTLSRQ